MEAGKACRSKAAALTGKPVDEVPAANIAIDTNSTAKLFGKNDNPILEYDMSDQLQDLLKRVYEEGVAKANAEAEAILEKARAEAAGIVDKAKKDADTLVSEAQKKAADLAKNADSDLKFASDHILNAVKQKLTDAFLDKVFDQPLSQSAGDPEFLKKLILETVSAWKESSGTITIADSLKGKLDEHFLASLKGALGQAMKVEFSPQMKNGFSISPKDGGYKMSFTDEDFGNLFKSYLRPRSARILFKQ